MAKNFIPQQLHKKFMEAKDSFAGVAVPIAQSIFKEYYINNQGASETLIEDILKDVFADESQQLRLNFQSFLKRNLAIQTKINREQTQSNIMGKYILDSLIYFKDKELCIEKSIQQMPNFDIPHDIKEYFSQNSSKKPNGVAGLLNEKPELQEENTYTYNQFVANKMEPINLDEKHIEKDRILFRAVVNFQFTQAYEICHQQVAQDNVSASSPFTKKELCTLLTVLTPWKSMHEDVEKDRVLSKYLRNRQDFEIGDPDMARKGSELEKQKNLKLPAKVLAIKNKMQFLVDMCRSMSVAFTNQYFRSICIFLGNKTNRSDQGYDEISLNDSLSLKERFFFARKFLTSELYHKFKQTLRQQALAFPKPSNIILFGKQEQTELILQDYLDMTSDLELVAMISVYCSTLKFTSRILKGNMSAYDNYIYTYKKYINRQSIDKLRLFEKKCEEIEKEFKGKKESSVFTCSFKCAKCSTPQTQKVLLKNIDPKKKGYARFVKDQKRRLVHCPECLDLLPRCCVCLVPLSIKNPYLQYDPQRRNRVIEPDIGVGPDTAISWCMSCHHGGHLEHLVDWFVNSKQSRCPVASCNCQCGSN